MSIKWHYVEENISLFFSKFFLYPNSHILIRAKRMWLFGFVWLFGVWLLWVGTVYHTCLGFENFQVIERLVYELMRLGTGMMSSVQKVYLESARNQLNIVFALLKKSNATNAARKKLMNLNARKIIVVGIQMREVAFCRKIQSIV